VTPAYIDWFQQLKVDWPSLTSHTPRYIVQTFVIVTMYFDNISTTLHSGASTPSSYSSTPGSFPTTPSDGIDTPGSEKSVLFDDLPEMFECGSSSSILVIGGLGYIGSHTVWELLKAGQNVVIVDNCCNSYREVFEKLEYLHSHHLKSETKKPSLAFHQADYRDNQVLRDVLSLYHNKDRIHGTTARHISGVIHFAAYKAVAESFQKPLQYYENNVSGVIQLCSTLAEFGIKNLVFSSSATVYGELADNGGRLFEQQCDSSGAVGLTNPYGRTKWMCEAILSDLAFSDPEWNIVALRYFNPIGCDESGVLGEDPRGAANNLMPIVVRTMMGELPILKVFGTDWDTQDGTAIRDFIHVSDLAAGHLAALDSMTGIGPGYHVFNLGTGTGYSVNEIVSTMQIVSKRPIPMLASPRREGDVGMCIADPTKSATILGWEVKRNLSQACQDICRYLRLDVA
jgi:UDP-glucose 4-epimerase